MFYDPRDYGRKAEELLWRKVYYEVIQLMKHNKKVYNMYLTYIPQFIVLLVDGVYQFVTIKWRNLITANASEQLPRECIQDPPDSSHRLLPSPALQTAERLQS